MSREPGPETLSAAIAGITTVVLIVAAGGYGYHRDELYFIAAGQHLDWAYADQGPLTPLIARLMTEIAPASLTVLRLPSALSAGLVVLLTGLMARELGGNRLAVALASTTSALGVIVLFTGHLLSTSTFDLLCWTTFTWLVVKAIRGPNDRMWLSAGAVLGIGMLNKPLPAFLAVAVLLGMAVVGPRHLLRNRWMWTGAIITAALALPFLIWQAKHGWPQLDVASAIAGGGSASSEPWWAVVPFQALLVSPMLAPIWIVGLVRLLGSGSLRDLRFLGWSWLFLALLFTFAGGKPYYLAGLLPLMIAAGSVPIPDWLGRGRPRLRVAALVAALLGSAVIDPVIALPVLPPDRADLVIAANEDVGETIGWPELVEAVGDVHTSDAVIFTANYGEAGAIDMFGPKLGLPRAYSGHNAYADWGPPPDSTRPVVVVGTSLREAEPFFAGCTQKGSISNDSGVENEEHGAPILLCASPRSPWSKLWPLVRHLG